MCMLDTIGMLCVAGALIAGVLLFVSWLVYTGVELVYLGDYFPGLAMIILAVFVTGLIIAGIEAGA